MVAIDVSRSDGLFDSLTSPQSLVITRA